MGQIAAGYDVPEGQAILTHVKGILAEPRLAITHVADRDQSRAEAEVLRFGLNAKIVSTEAILATNLDVLCIATPDGTHIEYIEQAVAGTARIIFAEKPIEGSAARRNRAVAAIAARGAAFAVHHSRRWLPGLDDWIAKARVGKFGQPLSATVHYNRGFRHNGSHALDLIAAFLGTKVVSVATMAPPIADFAEDDPTLSLLVSLAAKNGTIPMAIFGVDGREQTVFSVDLRFQRARVIFFDEAGSRAELHQPAKLNSNEFSPELRPFIRVHDQPPQLLAQIWRNIADHLSNGAPIACSGKDALAGYDLIDAILEKHS